MSEPKKKMPEWICLGVCRSLPADRGFNYPPLFAWTKGEARALLKKLLKLPRKTRLPQDLFFERIAK